MKDAQTPFAFSKPKQALQAEDEFLQEHGSAGPVAIYRIVTAVSDAAGLVGALITRRARPRRRSATDARLSKSAAKA